MVILFDLIFFLIVFCAITLYVLFCAHTFDNASISLLGFDCGVFTCMFADFVSNDCPLLFNQDHIDQCRDRIALSIMKNCAIE